MYHKIPGSNFEKPTFETLLIIAADTDIPLEDTERVKAKTWEKTNFQGVRDAIKYYGAGMERAESVLLYKRDTSMHSICYETLLTTRVQYFHNEVPVETVINALITDARISPDVIECVYQITYKENVGTVNEFNIMYRICVVWKADKCRGTLPVVVFGRELRKLKTYKYRSFVHSTVEQTDLPGRDVFRLLGKHIVPWDKIVTAKPTMITNQRTTNQALIGVLKGGSNQGEEVTFSSEAQNKQRMQMVTRQEAPSNTMPTSELMVTLDEALTRKKREEDQLRQFNDRMQVQADMQRALQTRVDMLESVGQQSIHLNAINHGAIVTSTSEFGQEVAKQLQQVQYSLRLLQGRMYSREPLTSAELDMVKYDYTKAGLPEPEYNANLFPEARYREPTLRVMTLQPVDGTATVADGYRIEEPVVNPSEKDSTRQLELERTIPRGIVQKLVQAQRLVTPLPSISIGGDVDMEVELEMEDGHGKANDVLGNHNLSDEDITEENRVYRAQLGSAPKGHTSSQMANDVRPDRLQNRQMKGRTGKR
jgi:hypothetical protein